MKPRTGFTQSPTPLQILTYVVYVLNIFFTYTHIQILQESLVHYILLSVIILISSYFSIRTTASNPTDAMVIYQQQHRGEAFDYEAHQLTQFCDLCIAYVKEQTKHCKACNRCCEDFDHHCKWINNCVGGVNYRIFMIMIVTTSFYFLWTIVIHGRVLKQYPELDSFQVIYSKNRRHIFAISMLFLILDCIAYILLLQLIIFHIYIYKKGLTTYEYIINSRTQKIQPQNQSDTNIINRQDSKIEMKNDQEQTIVFRQDKDKNSHSQIYTISDVKKDDSQVSLQKNGNLPHNRKLTQGDTDDQQNNGVNYFSQRFQTNADYKMQQKKYATLDAKTPELTQFQ